MTMPRCRYPENQMRMASKRFRVAIDSTFTEGLTPSVDFNTSVNRPILAQAHAYRPHLIRPSIPYLYFRTGPNIISIMSYGLRTVRKILAVNQFTRSWSDLETDNRP